MSKLKKMNAAIETYRTLASIPIISTATLSNNNTNDKKVLVVNSDWTQSDLERFVKIRFCKSYTMKRTGASFEVLSATSPTTVETDIWKDSPSGDLKAVVRSVKGKDQEKEKQFIEVWTKTGKLKNFDIEAQEKHGQIYDPDGQFDSFQWSHDEQKLLYVAEMKKEKSESYFSPGKKAKKDDTDAILTKGDQFLYEDNWGEQLTTRVQPVLCVLDIETGDITVLETPDNVSPGQAIWAPDDVGVVFVGWDNEPYKLGLIYCPIRRSRIYYLDMHSESFKSDVLSTEDRAVSCPRFSPDGSKLIYLANNTGGPHVQCRQLYMLKWDIRETVLVQDFVNNSGSDDFPGLFCFVGLPHRCWSSDSRLLIMSSFWRSRKELLVIDTEEKVVRRMTNDLKKGSWELLDVKDDIILASNASPNTPNQLVIGKLPTQVKGVSSIKWQYLESETPPLDFKWKIVKHNRNDGVSNQEYESIVLSPNMKDTSTKSPLVVYSHGGPHSLFPAGFMLYPVGLCKLGYTVLLVNYRGSLGFGQDFVYSLPGNIGTMDVEDIQFAIHDILEDTLIDGETVYAIGGSHGGFLTAHLIGQQPDFFKAAAMRNPVINIASMLGLTDIPDWCAVEVGQAFDAKNVTTPSLYSATYSHSPIKYIDKVKTPTLIMLGAEDHRVPPSQGKEYWRALKARHIPVRLLEYPDNCHPLSKVEAESDCFVNICKWFQSHI